MLPYPVATDSMSSPERQLADVLGPQVFLGIKGGTDTLGKDDIELLPLI